MEGKNDILKLKIIFLIKIFNFFLKPKFLVSTKIFCYQVYYEHVPDRFLITFVFDDLDFSKIFSLQFLTGDNKNITFSPGNGASVWIGEEDIVQTLNDYRQLEARVGTIDSKLQTDNCRPPSTNYRLQTTDYQLPTTN